MNKYEKGMEILAEKFGGGKDNVISVATIALETSKDGKPHPAVRSIDAVYEDGVFYGVTYGQSNKMKQIAQNSAVSISATFESEAGQVWLTADGIGENLGWVLKEENAVLREKLRAAFAFWYDFANNEKDENCCYVAIRLTSGLININHHATLIHMDFANKSATLQGKDL